MIKRVVVLLPTSEARSDPPPKAEAHNLLEYDLGVV